MFLCIFFLVEDTTLSESMQPSISIVTSSLVGLTGDAVARRRARRARGSGDEIPSSSFSNSESLVLQYETIFLVTRLGRFFGAFFIADGVEEE